MKIALLFVLAFLGLCFAAPSTPVWPKAFSSSVLVESTRSPQPYFFRMFSDSSLNAVRRDGTFDPEPGTFVFISNIANFTEKTEYDVYTSQGVTGCQTRSTFGNYPLPNFENYEYRGAVLYGPWSEVAYRWILRNETLDVFSEILVDGAGDPVRFSASDRDRHHEVWTFIEFDAGAQDPDLFSIPPTLKQICSPAPTGRPTDRPTLKIQLH